MMAPVSPSRTVTAEVTQVVQVRVRSPDKFPPPPNGEVVFMVLPAPTNPIVLVVCVDQVVPFETMMLFVVVASAAMSERIFGKLNVQVGLELVIVRLVMP